MRLKKLAVSCLGASCFALMLVACSPTNNEHVHSLEPHAENASTCTVHGNDAYWECSDCGKFFADANGETEIDENSWLRPLAAHTLGAHTETNSTCITQGNTPYWDCSVCHKYFSDADGTTEVNDGSWLKPFVSHTLTPHGANDYSCTEAGNSAYWECSVCDKFFSDANGTTEIEEDSWILPAAHRWDNGVVTTPPTYDAEGVKTFTCSGCHETKTESISRLVAPTTTHGAFTEIAGGHRSSANNSIMIDNNKKLTNGTLSVKLKKATGGNGDNGVIFGLADGYASDMWEAGSSYYFFFISNSGVAVLGKVTDGVWSAPAEQSLCNHFGDNSEFDVKVIKNGNNIKCYVDDVLYINYTDAAPITGDNVGIRAGIAGVEFTDFAVNDDVDPITADTVIIGSSVMEFWTSYESDLTGLDGTVMNLGISGSQTSHWTTMTDEVIAYSPSRILFYCGGNDLTANKTPEQVSANYTQIFDALKAGLPDAELVIITIQKSAPPRNGENITAINNAAKAYAAAHSDWVKIADIENVFLDENGDFLPPLFTDGLHLKPAGYRLLANVVRETLELPALEAPMFMLTEGTVTQENGVITTGSSGNVLGLRIGENDRMPAGTVSAKIKAGELNPDASYGKKNGIIFAANYNNEVGANNSALYWNASTVKYYFYYIDAVSGELCFVRFTGGMINEVQAALPAAQKIAIPDFDADAEYELKVEWDGSTAKCYLDGVEKITFTDTDPFTGKYVGFRINSPGTVISDYEIVRASYGVTLPESLVGGSITASKTTGIVSGETVTLTVAVDDGYRLEALEVNGETVTVTDGVATFVMPEGAVTVTADIVRVYAVTAATTDNGSISADKAAAKEGETVTVTVTPASGYKLATLTYTVAGGSAQPLTVTDGVATFEMPAGAVTVQATFEEVGEQFDIVVTPVENNAGEIVVADKAGEGELVTVTVTANEGFTLDSLTYTVAGGTAQTITVTDGVGKFTMPAEAVTITASFARLYGITVTAPTNGTLTMLDGKTSAKENEVVTAVVTPNSGYKLASLTVTYGDGQTVTTDGYTVSGGEISFDMPASAVTVTATFETVSKFTVRSGSYELVDKSPTSTGTHIKSTKGASIAILTGKSSDRVSITMSKHTAGDNGIVFALTDNDHSSYWETNGEQYYSFFITASNGNSRLATINPNWKQVIEVDTDKAPDDTYKMEAILDRANNKIHCFVNGSKVFTIDGEIFAGTAFGVRAGEVGVEYEYHDVADKKYLIIDDGTTAKLQWVDSGATVEKPADPVKDGYTFVGWSINGGDANNDAWGAVNSDTTITAQFELDQSAAYAIRQGSVDASGANYKTTANNTLFVLNNATFTQGSIEATIKPTNANDCALIFGANVTDGATWENFDYYIAMINASGSLFLAKASGWNLIAAHAIPNFNAANTYTVKAVYNDGCVRLYCDNTLYISAYIGNLPGSSVGFRAASANTEFGKIVTINADDKIGFDTAWKTDVTLVKRSGADMTANGTTYTSTGGGTVYTSAQRLTAGGAVSVTMNIKDAAARNECNGIIFGLPEAADTDGLWERKDAGDNYYFFFISDNGNVRLSKLLNWAEPFTKRNTANVDINVDHTLTVSWDGNGVQCYVDGVLYFSGDTVRYNGPVFGLRVQTAGVVYKDIKYVDYAATDET